MTADGGRGADEGDAHGPRLARERHGWSAKAVVVGDQADRRRRVGQEPVGRPRLTRWRIVQIRWPGAPERKAWRQGSPTKLAFQALNMSARRVPSVMPLCSTLCTRSSHSCGIALRFGRGGGSAKNHARSTPGARAISSRWRPTGALSAFVSAGARQIGRGGGHATETTTSRRSTKAFPRPRSYTIRRAGSPVHRAAAARPLSKKAGHRATSRRHPNVFAVTITLLSALEL